MTTPIAGFRLKDERLGVAYAGPHPSDFYGYGAGEEEKHVVERLLNRATKEFSSMMERKGSPCLDCAHKQIKMDKDRLTDKTYFSAGCALGSRAVCPDRVKLVQAPLSWSGNADLGISLGDYRHQYTLQSGPEAFATDRGRPMMPPARYKNPDVPVSSGVDAW